jgi:predicted nucleotidyltransferase
MSLLSRGQIIDGLERLGQLAVERGEQIELLVVGGAAMVLAYAARPATHDVDVVILSPGEAQRVRALAGQVAAEQGWAADWLTDAVKGYVVGVSEGAVLLSRPGVTVRAPGVPQLLAMKLMAWRDKVDIEDARRLLREIPAGQGREAIWQQIQRYLLPGRELKAQYAFEDLWEAEYGDD